MMPGGLEHNKNKFAARGLRAAHGWRGLHVLSSPANAGDPGKAFSAGDGFNWVAGSRGP